MTLDDDTRALLDRAFRLPGDLATTAAAGEHIRAQGGRVLRRRRLAAVSVTAGVAAVVAAIVLGTGVGGAHRSSRLVPPATPAPSVVTSHFGDLTVALVTSSHPQYCGVGDWQSLDLSTCYAVDPRVGRILVGFRVALALPELPPADQVDAAIPPAVITIIPTAAQRRTLATLGKQADKFVLASQGRPFAELSGTQLDAPSFRVSGAPDVMEHAYDLLLSRTWSPPQATLPPNNASPEDVVRAYIGALNRHNEATVKALRAKGANELEPWSVENIVSITHLTVDNVTVSGSSTTTAQTASVPVSFDLRQIQVDSMENGHRAWGYTLVRPNNSAPWRIDGEGVG